MSLETGLSEPVAASRAHFGPLDRATVLVQAAKRTSETAPAMYLY